MGSWLCHSGGRCIGGTSPVSGRHVASRRVLVVVAAALVAVAIGAGVVAGYGVQRKAQRVAALLADARTHAERAGQAVPIDLWALRQPWSVARLGAEVAEACRSIEGAAAELELTDWLESYPRFAPQGARLAQVRPLIGLARATCGTAMAQLAQANMVLEPIQAPAGQRASDLGPAILAAAARAQQILPTAGAALDGLEAVRRRVRREHLDGWLAPAGQQLDRFDAGLARARTAVREAPLWLEPTTVILGAGSTKRYVVLGQNSHELRPTGGFISGIGLVTVRDGRIEEMEFRYSPAWDNSQRERIPPPWPFERYMAFGAWYVRDANWWADFPSSARQVERFWAADQGTPIDGVIALDDEAVRAILEVTGPVELPDWDLSLEASDFFRVVKEASIRAGKARSLPAVYRAVFERLLSIDAARLSSLTGALSRLVQEKHLQVYLDDAEAQALAVQMGWDGAMREELNSDYLFAVDTTVTYSEVNQFVSKAASYAVRWAEGTDTAERTLVLRYRNGYSDQAAAWEQSEADGSVFDVGTWSMKKLPGYWGDWLRVYVPKGSDLLMAEGLEGPIDRYYELDKQVFGGFFGLQPGEERTITLHYRGPAPPLLGGVRYRLVAQKQAGAPAYPLNVIVQREAGRPSETNEPVLEAAQLVVLRRDEHLELELQPQLAETGPGRR